MTATPPTPNPEVRGPFECQVPWLIQATPDASRARNWLANGGDLILQPHVGGLFFIDMVYGNHTYPHYGRYLQVETNRRLEFTWVSQGTLGKESIVLVEFEPNPEGTQITLTHRGLPDEKLRDDHRGGWTELLEWMENRLAD